MLLDCVSSVSSSVCEEWRVKVSYSGFGRRNVGAGLWRGVLPFLLGVADGATSREMADDRGVE